MKIETIEISGVASALRALRLPFGREPRSICKSYAKADITTDYKYFESQSTCLINKDDYALLERLIKAGDEHAKVMRGIIVWAEITAPIYWFAEEETYVVGHQRLCSESTMHIDCKGLVGEDLQRAKASIPMGRELTKIDYFSYQCLRNIYRQRKNHRLPEWREFCAWIEKLPFARDLIICE